MKKLFRAKSPMNYGQFVRCLKATAKNKALLKIFSAIAKELFFAVSFN